MSLSQKPNNQDDSPYLNQIIDFRNGRYQGSADIFSRRPYGKGMFLDENFLFVLSDWMNGIASGKTFAIYPDHHIFYGNLYENRTNKLCAYKQPGKFTIYLKHFINENNLAIIDDYVSQSLLVLYVNYKEWSNLSEPQRKNKSTFVAAECSKNKYIDVVDHKVYLNDQQKWKIIEQYSKEKVEVQYRTYSAFISSAFNVNQSPMLISYQNASEYELSYEGSSIVCKINKNERIEQDYNIKLIGIYDEDEEIFETYKKVKGNNKIEEFVKGCSTFIYEQRPRQCRRKMREFYKKSTIFYNSFVKMSSLYEIKHFFMALSEYIDYFLANKYAQTFLYKNSNTINQPQDRSTLKKIDAVQLKTIQEQIQKSVCKKSSPERRRIKNYCQSLYENEQGIYARIKRHNKQQNKSYLESYIWMVQNGPQQIKDSKRQCPPVYQNKSGNNTIEDKKSYKVLINDQKQNNQDPIKMKLPKKQVHPLSQITPQFQSNLIATSPIKENLSQLTKDLISIQNQLKRQVHQTPKKHSKVSNNNSSSRSPYAKQVPSPKASSKRSDRCKANEKEINNGYSSPLQVKKLNKMGWR